MSPPVAMVDVWANNEEAELALLRGLARKFPIAAVAMSQDDAPACPVPDPAPSWQPRTLEDRYEAIRARVERVRLAQVGLALLNRDGELALGGRVWRFHLGEDSPPQRRFADPYGVCGALMSCSRAGVPNGIWVTSDGANDMAYLVRYLNGGALPLRRDRFLHLCNVWFPELKVLAEWTTVTAKEPPLAAAGSNLFGRFLVLAREWQFKDLMIGYNAFLSSLGAADDYRLISHERIIAEYEDGVRRLKGQLLQNGYDEEYVRNLQLC